MHKTILVTLVAGVSLLAQTPPPAPAKKTATATAKKPATPTYNRALLNPALLKAKAPDVYKATFTTTKGDFVIEVHRDWAPNGADRFYNLVKNGYFTDVSFFRAISGFMVQFGISPSPAITKAWHATNLKDDPVKEHNQRGYVTFAMTSQPNSRTTQMFINLADNSRLDPSGFAPIGTVAEGMDVVDKLYTGYGEGAPGGAGPDQQKITEEGKPYLDKNFPQLDGVKSAKITFPVVAPTARPAVKKPATATSTAKPAAK
jgi:peptidyl-prolyl cis-trans isomerase A (cyclophilin A)